MKIKDRHIALFGGLSGLCAVFLLASVLDFSSTKLSSDVYGVWQGDRSQSTEDIKNCAPPSHIKTPEPLKAIYMSQCVVGSKSFRQELVRIADTTEINALVIDIKDYSGFISFRPKDPKLAEVFAGSCGAEDMRTFVSELHRKNIYVIGRISVFQDPFMTKKHPELAVKSVSTGGVWKDFKGLSFIDVASRDHWNYIVDLSKEAYAAGFDELNYDYIRYPSDGNMKDAEFNLKPGETKADKLKEFFAYLKSELENSGAVLSADLFGMTTTSKNDLNIGQVLENALPYFDYIAPMVYPSHYPKTFNGYADPNKNVYGVINFAMKSGVERVIDFYDLLLPPILPPNTEASTSSVSLSNAVPAATSTATTTSAREFSPPELVAKTINKLRPWLQDFDYGGNYDIPEVKAQIQATYDNNLHSWMLWSPSNKYTLGALKPEISPDRSPLEESCHDI